MTDVTGIESNLLNLKQSSAIATFLEELGSLGPSLILGGAVRDWIYGKPHRDIDIVVDCSPSNLEWLSKYSAEKNRFNGYYLKVDGIEFDIWALDSTWALKKDKSFEKTLRTIPRTVFLTMDAVGYRLDTKEVYDSGFNHTVSNKQLGIMYEPNPFPFLCVSRALVGLVKYDLTPTLNLKNYIDEQVSRGYNKKSFDKYLEMRNIQGNFEEAMARVSNGL